MAPVTTRSAAADSSRNAVNTIIRFPTLSHSGFGHRDTVHTADQAKPEQARHPGSNPSTTLTSCHVSLCCLSCNSTRTGAGHLCPCSHVCPLRTGRTTWACVVVGLDNRAGRRPFSPSHLYPDTHTHK